MFTTDPVSMLEQVQPTLSSSLNFLLLLISSVWNRPWLECSSGHSTFQPATLFCDIYSLEGGIQTAFLVKCILTDSGRTALLCCALPCTWHGAVSCKTLRVSLQCLQIFYARCLHAPLHKLLCINLSLKCRNTNKASTSFTSRSTGCLSFTPSINRVFI